MLPMFARRPIVLGGLIAPVLCRDSVFDYAASQSLLASRINWIWFMASQIAFGVVAGIVVVRQERVSTRENLPSLYARELKLPE